MTVLQDHPWPGNVRELQSVVERAVLLSPNPVVGEEDLGLSAPHTAGRDPEDAARTDGAAADHEVFREAKARVIRQFERTYLVRVMAAVDGNVSRAARLAGMQRRDFQRLLRKHDIRRAQPRVWVPG